MMFLLCFCWLTWAQEPLSGLPYSTGLRRLQGRYFTLVYPQSAEQQAQYTANVLATVVPEMQLTLGHRPITIILNDQQGMGNGAVAFLPRRAVFYLHPTANEPLRISHSGQWLSLLAIHEYQHVHQLARSYHYGGAFPYFFFGEIGWALVHNLSQPFWFSEGEAVLLESRLTPGGRGRSATFAGQMQALYEKRPNLSVEQLIVGSYRQPIVDHYRLGWLLVGYGFEKYGEEFWPKVSAASTKRWLLPFPMERAIRRETGLSLDAFYRAAIQQQAARWKRLRSLREEAKVTVLVAPKEGSPMNWYHPRPLPDGSVLAVREGPSSLLQLVRIGPDKRQQVVRTFGPRNALAVGVGKNLLVFDEIAFHPLDQARRPSDLYSTDLNGRKLRRLTRGGMYSSPIVMNQDKHIAAIQKLANGTSKLVVLAHPSGKVVSSYDLPEGDIFDLCQWGETFVYVRRSDKHGNRLEMLHPEKGDIHSLSDWTWQQISAPRQASERYLLFHYAASSGDEIRAIEQGKQVQYRVAATPYGAYAPSLRPDGKTVVFSESIYGGSRLVEMPFQPQKWSLIVAGIADKEILFQSPPKNMLQQVLAKQWPSEAYPRWRGLLHFHSWLPYLDVQSGGSVLQVQSNNMRESLQLVAELGYNGYEAGWWTGGELRYREFWPTLLASGSWGQRQQLLLGEGAETGKISWRERQGLLGVELPVVLHRGAWLRYWKLEMTGGVVDIGHFQSTDYLISPADVGLFEVGQSPTMSVALQLQNLRRKTARDLLPKWGQALHLSTIGGLGTTPSIGWETKATLFFPGLAEAHHLQLEGGYIYRWGYPFRSQVPFVRGYTQPMARRLVVGKSDYQFALFSPDSQLGRWLVLRRISSGVFFDYGQAVDRQEEWQSAGGRLLFEVHLMRFPVPFPIGIEGGVRLHDQSSFMGPVVQGEF